MRALLETPRVDSAAGACWGSVTPGERRRVALYVAPTPAIARARSDDWTKRFGPAGVAIAPLAELLADPPFRGAVEPSRVDVFVATPQSLLACAERARGAGEKADVAERAMESVVCVLLGDVVRDAAALADVEAASALARAARSRRTRPTDRPDGEAESMAESTTLPSPIKSESEPPLWPANRTRFAAVSAPVSNARELGAWLGARPSAVLGFGRDRGFLGHAEAVGFHFPFARSEFAFERALDARLADVLISRRRSPSEPALVFCASREGARNAARALAEAAEATGATGKEHPFARDVALRNALRAAAARMRDATLQRTVTQGVGVYTSDVCRADREFLEVLFEERVVTVLCCSYAAGVSRDPEKKTILPAHVAAPLCVVRGTRRYDGGGAYVEMDEGDLDRVLSTVRCTTRDEHAADGVDGEQAYARLVIMTRRETRESYARRANGWDPRRVESTLAADDDALAERVNGLFVRGALTRLADAEAWFRETLAGFRARASGETRRGIIAATRRLRDLGALTTERSRSDENVDRDEGPRALHRRLVPTALGAAMADARATLETMRAFLDADPVPATTRELLTFLCGLAEFGDAAPRRNEKKLLRDWNRSPGGLSGPAVRFPVMQEGRSRNETGPSKSPRNGENAPRLPARVPNPKPVVATAIRTAREKLFVLAQASLSDAGDPVRAEAPERARRETDRFLNRAAGYAAAAFAAFAHVPRPAHGRFGACFAAARLAASLAARRWDDTPTPLSQFVPLPVAARLADAGIASLDDALARSPRALERAAGLAPPFGEALLERVSALPPAATVSLAMDGALDARGASQVTVRVAAARSPPSGPEASFGAASDGKKETGYARVLVGCLWKDTLLFEARVAREWEPGSGRAGVLPGKKDVFFSRTVELPRDAAPPPGEASSVVAALVHERCLGRDAHAELALPPRPPASPEPALRGTPARSAVRRARIATPPSAAARREERGRLGAAPRVDLTRFDSDDDFDFDSDAAPRKTPRRDVSNVFPSEKAFSRRVADGRRDA